jgi:hypothetical protein
VRAQVAYYLRSNGHTVMLCACDTFRSGAVEQLRVHGQCLDVPVFERGYGRDASQIAADGIAHAKQQGIDVVLVDTAGRMQVRARERLDATLREQGSGALCPPCAPTMRARAHAPASRSHAPARAHVRCVRARARVRRTTSR